jgi:hypothetical protein
VRERKRTRASWSLCALAVVAVSGMPFSSVTVNVTATDPAGSEATDASRMSLRRPAPAICVGAGVGDGDTVGVVVDAGAEFELLPPQPAMTPATTSRAKHVRKELAVREHRVPRRSALCIASPIEM